MKIGERIKQIRLRRRLTQLELSKKTKMKPQNLSRIEKCKVTPNLKTIYKISQALEVSPFILVPDTEDLFTDKKGDLEFHDGAKEEEFYSYSRSSDLFFTIKALLPIIFFDNEKLFSIIQSKPEELLKDSGLTDSEIESIFGYDLYDHLSFSGGVDKFDFFEVLNYLKVNFLDLIDDAIVEISEDPKSFLFNLVLFLQLFLNNFHFNSDLLNSLSDINLYRDRLTKSCKITKSLCDLLEDKRSMTMLKITNEEILWLIRIPVLPGTKFSKEDYIEMLYLYRNAQQQNKKNKEGE